MYPEVILLSFSQPLHSELGIPYGGRDSYPGSAGDIVPLDDVVSDWQSSVVSGRLPGKGA